MPVMRLTPLPLLWISMLWTPQLFAQSSGPAAVQERKTRSLKPVTVCEVLFDQTAFDGKSVFVVGRFDYTDEGMWVSEEDCGRKLVTNGHVWPNLMWLNRSNAGPAPAFDLPVLDQDALKETLRKLQKTTPLVYRLRQVVTLKDGTPKYILENVKDRFVIIYGTIETRHPLQGIANGNGNGFGHVALAPVQIVMMPTNLFFVEEDGTLRPQ
jgi:hypothetical protein